MTVALSLQNMRKVWLLKMAKAKIIQEENSTPVTFTKKQLAASKKYAERKDLLNALLAEDRAYSISEVEEILDGFLKGKVISC